MIDYDKYTELLQWHKGVELFDYNPVVPWAIDMIQRGVETENMLILASFSTPVERHEIKPYVSGVLRDLNLEEKIGEYSMVSNAYFHVQMIADNHELRKNLTCLYNMCLDNGYPDILMPYYYLYFGWMNLDDGEFNYYYDGANLKNIGEVLKLESQLFIAKNVSKDEEAIEILKSQLNSILQSDNLLSQIWNRLKGK